MRLHHRLGAVTAGAAASATVAALFVGAPALAADDDGPVDAGITVAKIDNLPADFINGVDVSSILSEEESGVVFRDFDGNVADPFDVLADAGINYVRVRVWNDPYNSTTRLGYGAGNTDAARATEIAERATEAGMKVLVDFHYSDFWADPGKQKAPKAWASMTLAEKATATHDFTETTLQGMEDAGVDVGMVQIGNETNGMVAGVSGIPNMAQIFSAGSAAVREVYPDALVALHFTNPETSGRYAGYAAQLQTAGVDYDVFASSYYPYWHGTLANLTSVLSSIATTYGKQVMVAETSWAYTLADGDGTTNSVTSVGSTPAYPVSVQGQATEIRDVMAAVNSVSGGAGLGVFYWEPAWIPVPGATLAERQSLWAQYGSGWATTAAAEYDSGAPTVNAEGSGWDNQALFDYDGNPLESLRAFAYARTGAVAPKTMTSVSSPTVTAAVGSTVTLPSTVTVTYNDSSTEAQSVTWEDVLSYLTSAGTYTVHGTTSAGYATTATVTLTLTNSVVNPGFENTAATPWTITNTAQGCSIKATGDATSGTKAFAFYRASAFTCSVQQTITGLTPGQYTLSAWSHGGAFTSGTMELRGVTSEGTYNTPLVLTAWGEKHQASEIVTVGSDGQIIVSGQIANANSGAWGVFDDFALTPYTASTVDTSGLSALVTQANGLTRSVYSTDSVATLDGALHVAAIVLAASLPTQAQVDAATALVTDALAGLVVVGEVPDPTVTNPTVTVTDGDPITLPATVKVTFFDGRFEQQSVTWDDVLDYIAGPGTYAVHGVTSGGLEVTATVKVKVFSYLVNGDFEQGNLTGWTTAATNWPSHFWYDTTADSVHGTTAVNIYGSAAFDYSLTQAVAGLEPGTYRLTVQAHGIDSGTLTGSLNATTSEGTVSAPLAFTGWANWGTFFVDVTVPADGAVTVGVTGTGAAEDWGYVDDFSLTALPNDADTTALDAAVAQATGVDRDLYEADTLPALDDALAAYAVFAGASDPTQAAVDAMTQKIQDALDQLDLIDVPFTQAPKPTIDGTVKVGATLTATVGTWVPTPSGIAYQWLRNGEPIADANGASYTVTGSDVGAELTVTVTATKADVITQSTTSDPVTVPLQQFTTTPIPTISGGTTAGSTLTAKPGTWVPAAAAYSYQWQRNGKDIVGATSATYKLTTADRAKTITVEVTGLKSGFASVTKESAGKYIPGVFSAPTPKITGTPIAGKKLTVTVGTWSPKASAYTYQWYRDGKAISGQKGKTYTVKSSDLKHKITVKVTGAKTGYTSKTVTSASVTIVKKFASTGYASISGTAKVGKTLTAHRGVWKPAPSAYAYQWYRNGEAITGATHSTYKLTSKDKGKKVTVKVTAKKSGYLATSHTSPAVKVQ